MSKRNLQIAVIGGRKESNEVLIIAEQVGELIAKNEWELICGGMHGVMRSACLGASNVGGMTIGVLPGQTRGAANHYVHAVVATGMGVARNSIIAHSADAAIAVGGSYGTLSEIAYFLQLGKPVFLLKCKWQIEGAVPVDEPEEAIAKIQSIFIR